MLIASAGNDGGDVDANRYEPCVIPGVICVGALENEVNTARSYSNYGESVDIWAPTDVRDRNLLSGGIGTCFLKASIWQKAT